MATPRFDLVDIAKVLQRRKMYVLIVTLITAVLGTIIYLIAPKKYEATSEFFVANPLYTDRSNIFRSDKAEFIDYFGDEDDIDKVMAITKSELVRVRVMEKQNFPAIYNLDTGNKKDKIKLAAIFNDNYKLKRTENQSLEISYTDKDPVIAANVTNEIVNVVEEVYKNYYNNIRINVFTALQNKVREIDSSIASLTDTLANLRDQYKIYDIISPARQTIINSSIKSNGSKDFGRGVELVQNIEANKDKLVMDRADYISLINEFSTGVKINEMPLLQVITSASPPNRPEGFGLPLTILACAFIGFFFSIIWVLFRAYFRKLTSVER